MTTPSTSAQGPVAGWKLVPVEPTKAMMDAVDQAYEAFEKSADGAWCGAASVYRAMLAASPASPSPAASPASPNGARVKPLLWKEQTPPNGRDRFYDHVQADTPFGQFLIEWKSWQPHDSFTISFAGDYVETRYSLEEAKAFALDYLSVRILSALASDATPAPTSGARVKPLEYVKPHGSETLTRAETILGEALVWTHHEANGRWFWKLGKDASGTEASEADCKRMLWATYKHRILSALANGSEDGGWQDIKTAPKGRRVLVKFQSGEVEVCYQTDHGGGLMDSWRYAFARRGEQAPWPVEWCEIPGSKLNAREAFDATPAPTSGSEAGSKAILDGIAEALESAGYVHMANKAGIASILAELDALAKPASEPAGGDVREALLLIRPVIAGLIKAEYNVETWGLKGRLAKIDDALGLTRVCEVCGGDCSAANPPPSYCPERDAALSSSAGPAVEEGFAYRDENGDIAYQAAHPAPATVEIPETCGPYEARICKDSPAECCDYGVVSLSEGREVCRVWREQDARAIAAALAPATEGRS